MDPGKDLTLVEAAYLASACLAREHGKPESTPSHDGVLLEAALRFDPENGVISVRAVRVAVDEGIVKSWDRGAIVVDENAVVYIAGIKLLNRAGEFTSKAKSDLYNGIKRKERRVELAPHLSFESGTFVDKCKSLLAAYWKRLGEWVVEDPEVMGGLPCIRGTRIPVYTVLGRIEEGELFDEIARDFSHVPREALMAALIYSRTHPRRGRPRRYR